MEQLKVSLSNYLAGQEIRFEAQHKDIFYYCRYKVNGKWEHARICFENETVIVNGQAIKRGVRI
jgi:hypothetical protein